MKYLAILKDSFREALDTKVLYVMAALSLLLILLTAGTGFSPLPPQEAIPQMMKSAGVRMVWPDRGNAVSPEMLDFVQSDWTADNIEQLTDSGSYTARDYTFTLTVVENAPDSFLRNVDYWSKPAPENGPRRRGPPRFVADGKEDRLPPVTDVPADLMQEFIKHQLTAGADLSVRKVEFKEKKVPAGKEPNERQAVGIYVFKVATQGSAGVRGWPTDLSFLYGIISSQEGSFRGPPGGLIYVVENYVINNIGAFVALMAGIVITAFFIPNMLRKGTVDMLLAKPIHRPVLLIYKYLGGLIFMFMNAILAIGGVWLAVGIRSGIWTNGFLGTILTLTFFFAILYSISTLFGVLTRSTIVAIVMTVFSWFVFWVGGLIHGLFTSCRKTNRPWNADDIPTGVYWVSDAVHYVSPRISDLNDINQRLIADVLTDNERRMFGVETLPDINWSESVTVSLVFIAVMLGLSCWRFSRKDF